MATAPPFMASMFYRFPFLFIIAVICIGCANTEFQTYGGRNSVVEGRGGTRKVVDGWTFGPMGIRRVAFRCLASYRITVRVSEFSRNTRRVVDCGQAIRRE